MTLSELISAFRARIDDAVAPFLVSDERAALLLSEAEREASDRARLIYRTFEIGLAQGAGEFRLPEKVFSVDAVTFTRDGGRPRPINLTGIDNVEEHGLNLRTQPGVPHFAVHDPTGRKVKLYPSTNMAGVIELAAYRLPEFDMEQPDDEPEIEEQYHDGLVAWAAYRALSSKDSELYDPGLAGEQLGEFVRQFGERNSARVKQRHAERRRVTTSYGGIR